MSALLGHAKAFRALARTISVAAEDITLLEEPRQLLVALSVAHIEAAELLEKQMREEATAMTEAKRKADASRQPVPGVYSEEQGKKP